MGLREKVGRSHGRLILLNLIKSFKRSGYEGKRAFTARFSVGAHFTFNYDCPLTLLNTRGCLSDRQ